MRSLRHTCTSFLLASLVLAASLVSTGCNEKEKPQATAAETAQTPRPIEPNEPPQAPEQVSASHILIMHTESQRRPETVTRSKEEALALAQEVAKKAKAPGADFAALAKEYSDGPTAPKGGNLGNFMPQQMVKPFSDAVMALKVGEVSDPVETQFGYHIIKRQELQVVRTAAAKHILVMHKDAMRVPATITRTKEEALARIRECQARLKAGEDFATLVNEYSDDPTGPPRGGDLGTFEEGRMVPEFEAAVFACEVGGYTDVVETPFGYHLIYRYK